MGRATAKLSRLEIRPIYSSWFMGRFPNRDARLKSCTHNMPSATQFLQTIDDYLSQELALERIAVAPQDLVPIVHTSPFGVIPKKHKPGKWRLILDLSSPTGLSVNDGIDKKLCSLAYTSIDEVVKCIISRGQGAMLAKVDIKQAYRNVPVHPNDRLLYRNGMERTGIC